MLSWQQHVSAEITLIWAFSPLTRIHRYPSAAHCKSPLMILETQQENNVGKILDKITNYLLWLLYPVAINHTLAKLVIRSPPATQTLLYITYFKKPSRITLWLPKQVLHKVCTRYGRVRVDAQAWNVFYKRWQLDTWLAKFVESSQAFLDL